MRTIHVVTAERDYEGSENIRAFFDATAAVAFRDALAAQYAAVSAAWGAQCDALREKFPESSSAWRAALDRLTTEFVVDLWPAASGHPFGSPDRFGVETLSLYGEPNV